MPADPTPWDLAMEAIGYHGCDCDADTEDHLALHTCLSGRCEHALVTTAAERDRALGEVERLRLDALDMVRIRAEHALLVSFAGQPLACGQCGAAVMRGYCCTECGVDPTEKV